MRVLFAFAAFLAAIGNAEVIISSVAPEDGRFVFIGKFAFGFDPSGATVGTITLSGLSNTVPVSMYLYDDQPESWPAVYNSGLTCQERLDKARAVVTVVSPSSAPGRFLISSAVEEKLRPRFWYAVLVSGDCERSMSIPSYRIDFQNKDSPVGVNDEGLVTLYGFMFPLSFVAAVFAAFTSMRSRSFKPPPLRIWQLAVAMLSAAYLCLLIHWALYQSDGQGSPGFKGLGQVLQAMARVAMWIVLVLFASGVGITFLALSERSKRENIAAVGLTTVFAFLYVSLILWWATSEDPASTTFIWDSGFGITVLTYQTIFAALWYFVLVRTSTQESHQAKRRFYLGFGTLYFAWFLSLPLVAVVAAATSPWYRERTAIVLETLSDFGAISLLGNVVLHPAIASRVYDPLSRSETSKPFADDGAQGPTVERTGFEDL